MFSNTSIKAIGAVAYLKVVQEDGKTEVGFIMGKAKLAPLSEPTIPRLELCGAVLAAEMADLIQDELDLKLDAIKFCNETKRFYTCLQQSPTNPAVLKACAMALSTTYTMYQRQPC